MHVQIPKIKNTLNMLCFKYVSQNEYEWLVHIHKSIILLRKFRNASIAYVWFICLYINTQSIESGIIFWFMKNMEIWNCDNAACGEIAASL